MPIIAYQKEKYNARKSARLRKNKHKCERRSLLLEAAPEMFWRLSDCSLILRLNLSIDCVCIQRNDGLSTVVSEFFAEGIF